MIRHLAALALVIAGLAPAAAQDLPALYDVTGVGAGDVLNVREHPRATSTQIGSLTPGATGVEVTALSDSGDWGRVNTAERAGWVAMSYLAATAAPAAESYFDGPLVCYGTEPFWRLDSAPDGTITHNSPDADPLVLIRTATALSQNRARASQFVEAVAEGASLTGVLRVAECSDGMSDRLYGLSLDMALTTGEDRVFVSGCCTLAQR